MSILDSAIDWFKRAYDTGVNSAGEWSQEWQNAVDQFRVKARAFRDEYVNLQQMGQYAGADPELKKAYDSLMSKGSWIYNTIANLASKLDMMGGSGMAAMGALPLIPVAVIMGALAAITAWMSDAYIMRQKLEYARDAINAGHTAGDIDTVTGGNSLISIKGSGFQSLVLLGAVGAALYLVFNKRIKR